MRTLRTTIRLEEGLLQDAKRLAMETGRTLTSVISDALREVLARRPVARADRGFRLPTSGRGGTWPGIDLDRTGELLEIEDRERQR